jgi:RimJ/RimL family protein N-acetyltransferase
MAYGLGASNESQIFGRNHQSVGPADWFWGSIEVDGIMYAPQLQRTIAGTEAMYLMMKRAFDELGYRRIGQQETGSTK